MNDTRNRSIVAGVTLLTLLASERALAAGMEHMNHGQMNHASMGHGPATPSPPRTPLAAITDATAGLPSRHCPGTKCTTGR